MQVDLRRHPYLDRPVAAARGRSSSHKGSVMTPLPRELIVAVATPPPRGRSSAVPARLRVRCGRSHDAAVRGSTSTIDVAAVTPSRDRRSSRPTGGSAAAPAAGDRAAAIAANCVDRQLLAPGGRRDAGPLQRLGCGRRAAGPPGQGRAQHLAPLGERGVDDREHGRPVGAAAGGSRAGEGDQPRVDVGHRPEDAGRHPPGRAGRARTRPASRSVPRRPWTRVGAASRSATSFCTITRPCRRPGSSASRCSTTGTATL